MLLHDDNLPTELYDVAGIKTLEQTALSQFGFSPDSLMQNAGVGAFSAIQLHHADVSEVAIVCGKGHNAGDGLVLAQLLDYDDYDVTVFYIAPESDFCDLAKKNFEMCKEKGIECIAFSEDVDLNEFELIVDALLGTGIQGEVRQPFLRLIEAINESEADVISLDLPSGIDVDTGEVMGNAVIADTTVTYLGFKAGLFTGQAVDYVGSILLDDLDMPTELYETVDPVAYNMSKEDILGNLSARPRTAHKGDCGHVLVIGGDNGMPGSVRIAAEGAYRVGAGLVTVVTRSHHVSCVVSQRPEIMCFGDPDDAELAELLARADVVVVGPGLSQSSWSQSVWQRALEFSGPTIVDAGALHLLADKPQQRDNWVLTPHPGEAAKLLACSIDEIQSDRLDAASALQEKYGGIAVLKGAGTIVVEQESLPEVCPYGNPGMASGGMGDLLTGTIAGMYAQGYAPDFAVSSAVTVHAVAADIAGTAGERGLLASDLFDVIRHLVNPETAEQEEREIGESLDEDLFEQLLENVS